MGTRLGRWLLVGLVGAVVLAGALLVLACLQMCAPFSPATPGPTSPAPATPKAEATSTLSPLPTASTPPPRATSTPRPTATPAPTALPPLAGYVAYRVEAGETLRDIAARFRSDGGEIAALNRFAPRDPLAAGQALIIPLYAGQHGSGAIEGPGLEISRGLPGRRVAITLDAGAGADPAATILDTLRDYDVQVTFFLTGRWAEENPDLVRRMAAEGHEFGNHTYDHPHLTELDEAGIREQARRTEEIIRGLTGQSTRPYLRPPYGSRNAYVLEVLAREGYLSIYWTVDSLDSIGQPKTAAFLVDRVTHPTDGSGNPIPLDGAIFLMHVGNSTTAEALPAILDRFRQEGYQVVRVSEILRLP